MTIHDVFGTIGAVLIVGTYMLLQFDRLDPKRVPYSALNALGAALILFSLTQDFNLSASIVEGFWLLVSIAGIARARARMNETSVDSEEQGGVD